LLHSAVLIEYWLVTDGQTERQTWSHVHHVESDI